MVSVVCTYQDGDAPEHVERDEPLPRRRRRRRGGLLGHAAIGVVVAVARRAGLQIHREGGRLVAPDELVAAHGHRAPRHAAAPSR
jgi:hypothetical protein